jgi:hypothetical protein
MILAIFQRNHDVVRGIYWRSVSGLGQGPGRCKELQGAASLVVCLSLASPESAAHLLRRARCPL